MEDILDDLVEARFDVNDRFAFSEKSIRSIALKSSLRFLGTLLIGNVAILLATRIYSDYTFSIESIKPFLFVGLFMLAYAFYKYKNAIKQLRSYEIFLGKHGILRKINTLDDYPLSWSEIKYVRFTRDGSVYIETGVKGKNLILLKQLERFEEIKERIGLYATVETGKPPMFDTMFASSASILYVVSVVTMYIFIEPWAVAISAVFVVLLTAYFSYNYITNAQLSLKYKLAILPFIGISLFAIYKALVSLGVIEHQALFIP